MKKHSGFTLIELMVVMAIITILATAGISAYSWYIARADDLKTEIMAANLVAVTLEFKSTHNGRSPTSAELQILKDDIVALSLPLKETIIGFGKSLLPQAFAQGAQTIQHPAGSRPICRSNVDNNIICEITYYRFSDGKFAFGLGVRTKSLLEKNFHAANITDAGGTRTTYGMFVGNSPIVTRPELSINAAINAYNSANNPDISLIEATSLTYTSPTPPNTNVPNNTSQPTTTNMY